MRVLALLACGAAAKTPDWPAVRARGANASFSFPAFYVGGAAKCGTTTLSAWFAQHPRVLAPRVKEPFFFGKTETAQRRDMPDYFRDLRLESWWNDSSRATFDGTASYLVDKDPHTLYSLRAANPSIKLVVVFREPVTGQEKSAKFSTSKAPLSAVFYSFRLIFGRAIISRNGVEAWMLFLERARAEHSR